MLWCPGVGFALGTPWPSMVQLWPRPSRVAIIHGAGLMLDERRRRWPNIRPAPCQQIPLSRLGGGVAHTTSRTMRQMPPPVPWRLGILFLFPPFMIFLVTAAVTQQWSVMAASLPASPLKPRAQQRLIVRVIIDCFCPVVPDMEKASAPCRFNIGPAPATPIQRETNARSASRARRVYLTR